VDGVCSLRAFVAQTCEEEEEALSLFSSIDTLPNKKTSRSNCFCIALLNPELQSDEASKTAIPKVHLLV
jgi:hypothetical protein